MAEEKFTLTVEFKTKRARDYFYGYMCDSGGEQEFWSCMEEYADFKPNSIDDNPEGPDDYSLKYILPKDK